MLSSINRFSESVDHLNIPERSPMRPDELLTLINMAAEHGYTVNDARDMKTPYGVIPSDLFAVWYAIENKLCIFADNIDHLINLTGWEPSMSHVYDSHSDQDVNSRLVVGGI
jgi:hypothetical protein